MLEFMTERKHKARKEYTCDICGGAIHGGEPYYRCAAKWDGKMQDYCQHVHCRNMAVEYCEEQGESEYDADSVSDYIYDRFCCDCVHGNNEDNDCAFSIWECPKLMNYFSNKEETNDGSENQNYQRCYDDGGRERKLSCCRTDESSV